MKNESNISRQAHDIGRNGDQSGRHCARFRSFKERPQPPHPKGYEGKEDYKRSSFVESNVGKTIALRMKTRGCSWSRAGAKAMAAVLCHLPQLELHSFNVEEFRPTKKKCHSRTPASQKIISNATIHQASFPIVKIGKTSVPLYHLFRNIISPKELP